MINNDILKGKWSQLSGILKENWSELTDDDVKYIEGSYDRLAGKLQKYYGYHKEEVKEKIQDFIAKFSKDAEESSRDSSKVIYNLASSAKGIAKKYDKNIKELSSQVNEQVKKSPWLLAGITAVAGLTIGFLLQNKISLKKYFKS